MNWSRPAHLIAALLPPVLLLVALLLGAEAWLRFQAFGMDALLHPARYMAPRYKFGCNETGPGGELMTPDCRMRYSGTDLITNRHGINDREVDEQQPHYRIVALGDSYTLATGVSPREAWHALLEERLGRELQAPGFVEIYNYGRMGRNTVDYVQDLQDTLGLWPLDGALVAAVTSDFLENITRPGHCHPGDERFHLTPEEARLLGNEIEGNNPLSGILNRAEHETGMWIFSFLSDELRNLLRNWRSDPQGDEMEEALVAKGEKMFRSCAIRLREIADAAGIDLGWVMLAYEPTPHAGIMLKVLHELGEPVISMQDIHELFPQREAMFIFTGDSHPNAAVHRVYARRIHGFLDQQGWLERMRQAREKQTR